MTDWVSIVVVVVFFGATLVRSAFGFGEALIAVPLLALVLWIAGIWTPIVTRYYLLSLPTALLAIGLGRAINRRLDAARFLVYVHVGLIASGAVLLLQALLGS